MMKTTVEKSESETKEILKKLGKEVLEDETFFSLTRLSEEKRISFDFKKLTFTYFLKFPIELEDNTQIDSLIVRQATGGEMVKITNFNQHVQVSLDMLAIQNGFSSVIAERLLLQDIVNLSSLMSLFT